MRPVKGRVGDQVWKTWYQVCNQVDDQVMDKVWVEVRNQVFFQIDNQVNIQVLDQVWDQVKDKT